MDCTGISHRTDANVLVVSYVFFAADVLTRVFVCVCVCERVCWFFFPTRTRSLTVAVAVVVTVAAATAAAIRIDSHTAGTQQHATTALKRARFFAVCILPLRR